MRKSDGAGFTACIRQCRRKSSVYALPTYYENVDTPLRNPWFCIAPLVSEKEASRTTRNSTRLEVVCTARFRRRIRAKPIRGFQAGHGPSRHRHLHSLLCWENQSSKCFKQKKSRLYFRHSNDTMCVETEGSACALDQLILQQEEVHGYAAPRLAWVAVDTAIWKICMTKVRRL